ncbi:MAG: Crp/Fnr family transcriptional regulator [Sphaerospermopsis kisseleviana]|uniref:Transcriptional Regulator, Crp/Fnr family protein n=1 Tax=Sphaerospermopsis reniformis TaxID=531300 RepID=A0A479ZS38_9CYAN|nr:MULTISPECIES: Crp/Fnr family transcriptional regulator [Sphaerospermopsis]MBD2134573.1 Crp/Fnr family transcriptional regulator [Sphaerospermopsis sp. FACHB-1094]MBD2143986.1 Crp/Fnr family transcriptional regulator [Sphaerospermopsis sp. FACHB-1194]GCL35315.1 transcriptional Regulator, Crp/Fnr family protein [Sphaerospermopsis reniformis]
MTLTEKVLEVKNFLHQTPIFENIIDEQLQAVANIAILQTYKKNETLFWEGDAATGFFIVKSGKIKVFKVANHGKEQILHIFEISEYFAEVPAFDGGNFPASAAAIEFSEVVFIPRTSFFMVLQQHPTLAIAMLGTFARHLRHLTHLVNALSFQEVPERLTNYLLKLSQKNGNINVVELDLPKTQLAALLGTVPETLSRAFYKLTQEGKITVNGTKIMLSDEILTSKST